MRLLTLNFGGSPAMVLARREPFYHKIWMGEVVDPEPPADSVPRAVSMTWTDPCDVEVQPAVPFVIWNVHYCTVLPRQDGTVRRCTEREEVRHRSQTIAFLLIFRCFS